MNSPTLSCAGQNAWMWGGLIWKATVDFPGGPMLKTLPSNVEGASLIPGSGAKIPHASRQKNKIQNRSHLVTNPIKIFKMIHSQKRKKKIFKKRKAIVTIRKSSKKIITKALKMIRGYTGGVSSGEKKNWVNVKTGFKTINSQHQPCAPCKEGPPWESYTRRHFGLLHQKAFLILEIVQKRQPGKLASSWLWKSLSRNNVPTLETRPFWRCLTLLPWPSKQETLVWLSSPEMWVGPRSVPIFLTDTKLQDGEGKCIRISRGSY